MACSTSDIDNLHIIQRLDMPVLPLLNEENYSLGSRLKVEREFCGCDKVFAVCVVT